MKYLPVKISHILTRLLATALCLLPAFALACQGGYPALSPAAQEDGLYSLLSGGTLRLHILADSDAEADQAEKLAVRDYILETFGTRLSEAKGKAEAIQAAYGMLGEIESCVNAYLASIGSGHTASCEIVRAAFPLREYEGIEFPAGEYDALRVKIGSAEGKNWWCVLYPPLCIFSFHDAKAESQLGEDMLVPDEQAEGEAGFEVKWRIAEFWAAIKAESTEAPTDSLPGEALLPLVL